MKSLEDTSSRKWTFGHTDNSDDDDMEWRRKDTVEFWIPEASEFKKKSIWVTKDRLFQLGMKTYPEVVDLTQMSESSGQILEQLLIGHRRYLAHVSMNQASEICHVGSELKFVNLLKVVEKDMLHRNSKSMEHAVDALSVALRYGMKDGVEKLVDEIVFGFKLDEHFLIYCKNGKAVEMVLNRKAELEGYGRLEEVDGNGRANSAFFDPLDYEDVGDVQNWNELNHNGQNQQVALPRVQQNGQMHKVILNTAKEKFRTLLNRPITSVKNGIIAWVSGQNQRRRQPPPPPPRNQNQFHEFHNF